MVKVMENGADFGNNGDEPSRLTADIHNAKGDKNKTSLHISYAYMLCIIIPVLLYY